MTTSFSKQPAVVSCTPLAVNVIPLPAQLSLGLASSGSLNSSPTSAPASLLCDAFSQPSTVSDQSEHPGESLVGRWEVSPLPSIVCNGATQDASWWRRRRRRFLPVYSAARLPARPSTVLHPSNKLCPSATHTKGVNERGESIGDHGSSVGVRFPITSSFCAGAAAGAIAKTVIAPLDRTKINFQIRNVPYSLRMAFRFLAESYRKDGLTSWWRGNTATMARVIPYAALQYTAHEQWKKVLRVETREERKERPFMGFVAGSLAGVTASSLTYPLDLARARMAVSRCETYRNLGEVFLKIWRNEGPHALYRGFVPSVLGVVPYAGASFFTYEWLKNHRLDWKSSGANGERTATTEKTMETVNNEKHGGNHEKIVGSDELHPIERLACGAIAGLIGQSFSYPLDIVRRRMQTSRLTGKSYRTIRGTILHIWKHEGLRRGLFKGLTMNWIKGPIAVGTSFTVYDVTKNLLESYHI